MRREPLRRRMALSRQLLNAAQRHTRTRDPLTLLEFALEEIDRWIDVQRTVIRDAQQRIQVLQTQRQQLVDDQQAARAGISPKRPSHEMVSRR